MDIDKIIQKIIDNGKLEDMHELSDILEDVLEELQDFDAEFYRKNLMELYEMAYGCVLTEEMAKDIVSKMKPFGEKWTIQQTESMQQDYKLNLRPMDFYVVINSAYNDFKNIFSDNIELYIRYAEDFINDEDAVKDKVYLYYTTIPK